MDRTNNPCLNKPIFFLNNLGFPILNKKACPACPKAPDTDPEPADKDWIDQIDDDTLEEVARMTIDGKMTDDEALANIKARRAARCK